MGTYTLTSTADSSQTDIYCVIVSVQGKHEL